MFTQMLINNPTPAIEAFQRFQEQLTADYMDETQSADRALQQTLTIMSWYLLSQRCRLSDFGLPEPEPHISDVHLEQSEFEHRREELIATANLQYSCMNDAQKGVFKLVLKAAGFYQQLEDPDQPEQLLYNTKCFFLEGKAGHGKSYTVNAIISYIRGFEGIALICGSTALSVIIYERGRTAHSLFGIPVREVSQHSDKIVSSALSII
jgi:hypothetical protein